VVRVFRCVQDPNLQELSECVPSLVAESKAKNTRKKYCRGFERWQNWARSFTEIVVLPASSVHVCLFIVSLIQHGVSCSILDEVRYGLKWVHEIAGYENPCNGPLVLSVFEAAKRLQ
jgi:hypothetical protein